MNTFQIEEVCRSDPMIAAHFAGVYARDKLPEFPEIGKFYVCNKISKTTLEVIGL